MKHSKELSGLSGFGNTLEKCIANIEASNRLEGLEPTPRLSVMNAAILKGEISIEQAIEQTLAAYKAEDLRRIKSRPKGLAQKSKR